MWKDEVFLKLSDKETYHRNDLFQIFANEKEDLSDSAFRWMLYHLQKKQMLFRVNYDTYSIKRPEILPEYRPVYSDKAKSVMKTLHASYPTLMFVVFESVLLNEFLNHQIAQNTIYVQVEKEVSSYIFDRLQMEYRGSVLYKPGKNEFERYWTKNCIVVLGLVSQSPLSANNPHEITGEKMLVDIIAERSIAMTFSPSELTDVFENVMRNYQVDRRRMNRYAGRRGKADIIKKYTESR